MKINLDCIPCFLRQALDAVRFVSDDERVQELVLREVTKKLLELEWDSAPPKMSHEIHKVVRRITKDEDPYRAARRESNDLVSRLYPELKERVEKSEGRLRTAVRLAIAGNVIDLAPSHKYNLEKAIEEVLEKKFAVDDFGTLEGKLKDAKTLLFFADNAGEVGFDRLLIETMLREKNFERISFVVKGGPLINDATLKDAFYMGLDELPNVEFPTVSNGDPGTGPERSSPEVKRWIEEHDLVISKGQANYEALSEFSGVFFMLMVKCPIVAFDLNVDVKDIVLKFLE